MRLSLSKTEVTVCSAKKQDIDMQIFQVDGIDLPYNKTPKLLGIPLDEHLDFKRHIATIEAKTTKALTIIREVKGISGVGSKKLLQLYVILERSIMEYGSTVASGTIG